MNIIPFVCAALLSFCLASACGQNQIYESIKGKYAGLVFTPNESAHASSAFLNVEVRSLGGVTGNVIVGGRGRKVSGSILPDGQSTLVLYRGDKGNTSSEDDDFDWDVKGNLWLQFDLTGGSGLVWGFLVKDPSYTFGGQRTLYNRDSPAPQTGAYTVVLPPGESTSSPGGATVGTLDVNRLGLTRATFYLADGRQAKQQVPLTGEGHLPLLLPLYDGKGSLLGNLELKRGVLTQAPAAEGALFWTRPTPGAQNALPEGWFHVGQVQASAYRKPAKGESLLPFTHCEVVFTGGNLESELVHQFEFSGSKVVNPSPGLSLKFSTSNGLFNGSFVHPATGKKVACKGVVLQEQNCGYGYFLSPAGVSGLVYLGPATDP